MGINQLANISDTAIVGTVTRIAPARWNSKDGAQWCPPALGIRPFVYRDVTIEVSEVLFESERLSPKQGDELIIRTFGDGTDSGREAARFSDGTVLRDNQADGRFEEGTDVFVIVNRWDQFPTENGPERIAQITGSWDGHWQLDQAHDRARSVDPDRTVPFRALVSRLLKERQLGRRPERDPDSVPNPLKE